MQSGIGNAGRGAVIGGLLVSGAALYGAEPARTDVLDGRVPVRDLSPPACIAVTDVWAFDLAIGNEPSAL